MDCVLSISFKSHTYRNSCLTKFYSGVRSTLIKFKLISFTVHFHTLSEGVQNFVSISMSGIIHVREFKIL